MEPESMKICGESENIVEKIDDIGGVLTDEARASFMLTSEIDKVTENIDDANDRSEGMRTVKRDHDNSFRRDPNKFNLLIGLTGSVATIKLLDLISELNKQCPPNRLSIRIVGTNESKHFFDSTTLRGMVFYDDREEWTMWSSRGDPVLHIELRKWAHALLIAPLSANSLAKIANGICDNLLTSVVRAWDPNKSLYFAPAMNSYMWESALTARHLEILIKLLGFKHIPPIEKELICGDTGYGAMSTPAMIASVVSAEVKNKYAVYSTSSD